MRQSATGIVTALLCFAVSAACAAQYAAPPRSRLQQQIESITREPAVARAHWGISVTTLDGKPLAALNDAQFFQPASNNKLFTTAAAMALLPMEYQPRTEVIGSGLFRKDGTLEGSLTIQGDGDTNLSGRPMPYAPRVAGQPDAPRDELRYIDELAAQIRAAGILRVQGDVIGDDRVFPWDPFPNDWALDDLPWYYGAPINGLMIADNAVTLTVVPAAEAAASAAEQPERAHASLTPALPYYALDVQATTGKPGSGTHLDLQRAPADRTIHIYGSIAADAKPYVQDMSIADPAEYAALALKASLEAQGIGVTGRAVASHLAGYFEPDFDSTLQKPVSLPVGSFSSFGHSALPACGDCHGAESRILATHLGPQLYEDIVVTNKVSQNQHAEVFLRQLGRAYGTGGTTVGGARVVRSFLISQVGIDANDFYLNDGSGLSAHDLVTPRALTQLLRYAATQPWGAKWKASLPVGGVDGSLRARFPDPPLKNHVFAKTGTLGEARALSGYLDGRSGRTVVFSIMVTDHTPLDTEDQKAMDRIIAAVFAAE